MRAICAYSLPLLLLLLALVAYAPSLALADTCSAQLGFPITPIVQPNTVVTVIVPVSATCSTSYGTQIYVTATAFDLNTSTSADTVSTTLTSVNGGYTFTGQLGFTLPPSTQGHWVQISVTIYSDQSGSQLTTNGEAFQVTAGTAQVVTTTVTQQSTNQFAPTQPNHRPRNFLFAYVAIAAILAVVIIVTVGLVVYSHKQPRYYYQAPARY